MYSYFTLLSSIIKLYNEKKMKNGEIMKTLVFFDIDGTLFDNKTKTIPQSTIKAIKKLAKNPKIILGLASGRNYNQLGVVGDLVDLFIYKVLINGTTVYEKNELIYEHPLKKEDIKAICSYAEKLNIGIGLIGEKEYRITSVNDIMVASVRDFNLKIPIVEPTFYLNDKIFQLWLFTDDDKIMPLFEEKFSHLKFYSWRKYGFDIISKNTSKGIAIKRIKEKTGVQRVISFGDGDNDFDLITMADIGICMGNSNNQKLKDAASFVTASIDSDGIYKGLEKLGLIK